MQKRATTLERTPVLDNQRPLLTITQVAVMLNVTRPTVYTLIDNDGLPVIRLGERSVRVSPISLEQWLANREQVRLKYGA